MDQYWSQNQATKQASPKLTFPTEKQHIAVTILAFIIERKSCKKEYLESWESKAWSRDSERLAQ